MDEKTLSLLTGSDEMNDFDGIKIDTSIMQKKFEKKEEDVSSLCSICGKHVFQMEKVKAEKRLFHKTCFRCKECSKQLNTDTYSSHEGEFYCQIHFKQLFQPKASFDSDNDIAPPYEEVISVANGEGKQRKNEMIIRENIPQELPEDVVRSRGDDSEDDSKIDDGLHNYQLDLGNIRQRFESGSEDRVATPFSLSDSNALQRSESVSVRLQRYQTAVIGGPLSENGCDSASEESSDEETDSSVVRETKRKEKIAFSGMSSLKSQWENGAVSNDSKVKDKKEQSYMVRQRICLGRSASMRQVYESACNDTSGASNRSNSVLIESNVKAGSIKEKFEKGEIENDTEEGDRLRRLKKEKEEDLSVVVEAETAAREAKNKFREMDATTRSECATTTSPSHSQTNGFARKQSLHRADSVPGEVVKCSDPTEKEPVVIETNQLQERFKFFECFKEPDVEPKRFEMTPPPDVRPTEAGDETDADHCSDPNIIRSSDVIEDIPKTDTAKKMLNKFKQMESDVNHGDNQQTGPKPLKRITPPREYTKDENGDKEPSPERDPDVVRSSYKTEDIVPVEPEKARSLKKMFENWTEVEVENKRNSGFNGEEFPPKLDITKNLCAKFEAIKNENGKSSERPKPRVNRFVNELGGVSASDVCTICGNRIYAMEKLEFSGMKMHKNCFKCSHCMSSLRLDNYTLTAQKLYCIPHFKQLFMSKGNYDEGFGQEQHKEKWCHKSTRSTPDMEAMHDDNDNELIPEDTQE